MHYLCKRECVYNMERNSLSYILTRFLETINRGNDAGESSSFVQAIVGIFDHISWDRHLPPFVFTFLLNEEETNNVINRLKKELYNTGIADIDRLNTPITYLLDEFICNIQQHSKANCGYAYLAVDETGNAIDLIIADPGITIYGSYVSAQKYLDLIGNSDAAAIGLAQNGYSTKNLPNAENRGYGISSNIQMVVKGLHGELAIMSGNALLAYVNGTVKLLSLPKEVDFQGTMIVVRIPSVIAENFNLYDFIG